jgi:hypothetical protein
MSLDPKIEEAIQKAAIDAGQDPAVANRLIAWMTGISNGNETLEDKDSVNRHLSILFDAVVVEDDDEGEE